MHRGGLTVCIIVKSVPQSLFYFRARIIYQEYLSNYVLRIDLKLAKLKPISLFGFNHIIARYMKQCKLLICIDL